MEVFYKVNENYSYCSSTINISLESKTIRDKLDEMAKKYPNKVMCIYNHLNGAKLTYSDIQKKAFVLAQNFLSIGLRKGDRLGLLVPNIPEFALTVFACAYIGVCIVPFDYQADATETHYSLQTIDPTAMIIYNSPSKKIFLDNNFPEIRSCTKGQYSSNNYKSLKHIIVVNDYENKLAYEYSAANVYFFNELESSLLDKNLEQEFPQIDCDDLFMIAFTSGTTSRCKGAMIRHHSIYNCYYLNEATNSNHEDITYLLLALTCHISTICMLVNGLFFPNIKLVMACYTINFEQVFQAIEKYKCNYLFSLPVNIIYMLSDPSLKKYDLSSLKNVYTGGQIVTLKLCDRLRDELKIEKMHLAYGMTEILIVSRKIYDLAVLNENNYKFCIGRLNPFIEYKVINKKTGLMQPLNEEGELCLRSYSAIKGYWNDAEKTKEAIDQNGWFHTGDIVRMDSFGNLFFVNRNKDVIIGKGIFRIDVFPSEVEDILMMHSNVKEAAVFGVEINEYESEVCVWIKLNDKSIVTTCEELKEFCKNHLVDFKIPKYIKFVDEFPSSDIGKYLKKQMQKQYKEELGF